MRFIALLCSMALVASACAGQGEVPDDLSSGLTAPGEAHLRQEEAIQECMNEQGFDYQILPFLDAPPVTLDSLLFLGSGEQYGYGGVFSALTFVANPTAAPPDEYTDSETLAYDAALFGARDGPEAGLGDGCLRRGLDARTEISEAAVQELDFNSVESMETAEDFIERLVASTSYSDFSARWSDCLASQGWLPNTDPFQFGGGEFQRFLSLAEGLLIVERGQQEAEEPDDPVLDAVADIGPIVDQESMQRYLDRFPTLASQFADEVEQAIADQECRQQEIGDLMASLDLLSLEVYGIEFEG